MTDQNPGAIFKEYVKSLIVEIVNESDGLSLDTNQSDALEGIKTELDEVVRLFGMLQDSVDEVDFDNLSGLDDRIETLETALSDINSATQYL